MSRKEACSIKSGLLHYKDEVKKILNQLSNNHSEDSKNTDMQNRPYESLPIYFESDGCIINNLCEKMGINKVNYDNNQDKYEWMRRAIKEVKEALEEYVKK